MILNTKTIKLDINKKMFETITAKQGDTKSRFILFNLYDGPIQFDLTGRTVRVYGEKKDNTTIFNDLVITDAKKGYCTLELTNQMLAVEGMNELELVIFEGEKRLSTMPFILNVIGSKYSEDAIVSTNEFTALMNALKTVGDIDNKAEKKEVEKLSEQLDNIANKTPWVALDESLVINGDWSIAMQSCIDSGAKKIILPARKIRFDKSINITNRDLDSIIITGDTIYGSTIIGNTGHCVFDTTGSQAVTFENFSIEPGSTNSSTIGIIYGRSVTHNYAQFGTLTNININLKSNIDWNGGVGSIGVYNLGAELFRMENVFIQADTPCIFTNDKSLYEISSQYTEFINNATSTSEITISGASTLNAKKGSCLELSGVDTFKCDNIYMFTDSYTDNTPCIKVKTTCYQLRITGRIERTSRFIYTDTVIKDLYLQVSTSLTQSNVSHICIDGTNKLALINNAKISILPIVAESVGYSCNVIETIGNSSEVSNSEIALNKGQNLNIRLLKSSVIKCSNDNVINVTDNNSNYIIIKNDKMELKGNEINLNGDIKFSKMKLTLLNKVIEWGNSEPTSSTYTTGSIRFNSIVKLGGNVGWQCIAGGTPGTWRPFGQVGYQQYSGSPVNNLTPNFIGEEALDILNKIWYKSTGLTSDSWKQLN